MPLGPQPLQAQSAPAQAEAVAVRSGAQQQVEDVIAALTERALTVLDDVALRPEADAVLRELAAAATQRSV